MASSTSLPALRKVAIAGATTSLGLHILSALLTSNKFSVLLLTRSSTLPPPSKFPFYDHPNLSVAYNFNYTAGNQTAQVLKEHNVHTVIISIGCIDNLPDLYNVQLNLYNAAKLAGTVKRIILNEWEGSPVNRRKGKGEESGFWGYKNEVLSEVSRLAAESDDKDAGIEIGMFCPGVFMDYFSSEYMNSSDAEEGGRGWMPDIGFPFLVDFKNGKAVIPVEGKSSNGRSPGALRFTLTRDLAKFVAKVLGVDDWPAEYGTGGVKARPGVYEFRVSGDRLTPMEMVTLGENITGKKFTVEYLNEEKLREESKQAKRDGDVIKGLEKDGLLAVGEGEFDWNELGENGPTEVDADGLKRTVVAFTRKNSSLDLWTMEKFLRRWM